MKIQTFSIVVGNRACDARCPFCVSRLTGFATLPKTRKINRINFDKACRLAQFGEDEDIRTLIFYSNGELAYRWDYEGAVLLRGSEN